MKRISTWLAVVGLLIYTIGGFGCTALSTESDANEAAKSSTAPYAASDANVSAAETRSADDGLRVSGDKYEAPDENPFFEVSQAPLSTFSIDVDTASYSNIRRMIREGSRPPVASVRIEEMVNYFGYDYPQPIGDIPFSVNTEVATAPWKPEHKLVRIGLQGKKISMDNAKPSNLVFLLDVSGSMASPDKLPLLQRGLEMLVDQLTPKDKIAIVTYAGASGLALESTSIQNKQKILEALNSLESGGSTNGGEGIRLAYKVARENFIEGGNNRVILATDGDFNVGESTDEALVGLIEEERKSNVFLSVLGFGRGNLNDSMMEKLSNKGNGNYAYIDGFDEAKKALGEQVSGTIQTIAKDVKIQVEFNPNKVAGYRLIGYENRMLEARDFNDDRKDAGEIGAGMSVTAIYEVVPKGVKVPASDIDGLKYSTTEKPDAKFADELMTVKLRYKEPDGTKSKLINQGVLDSTAAFASASEDFRFAVSVAEFGLLLKNSKYKAGSSFAQVSEIAGSAKGSDLNGYRAEFLGLVKKAEGLRASSSVD
ncbi:MAG: VWA domain-containing protein [Pyrinomonadaceae bacterium]